MRKERRATLPARGGLKAPQAEREREREQEQEQESGMFKLSEGEDYPAVEAAPIEVTLAAIKAMALLEIVASLQLHWMRNLNDLGHTSDI